MKFSERIGLVKRVIQKDSMNGALKNALWNAATLNFWHAHRDYEAVGAILLLALWADHFDKRADEFPSLPIHEVAQVKNLYMSVDWASTYDFVEFIASQPHRSYIHNYEGYVDACNIALQKHVSAYRLVNGVVTPITSDEEIAEVEQAVDQHGQYSPVAHHLQTALLRFSDRSSPDYRNSIKESISAVEAACQIITGDSNATLGKALKQLGVHAALEKGFSAIYGYTSDADGIRHALLEESTVDADDAKFFLVSCSAFVNYLIAKASAGV